MRGAYPPPIRFVVEVVALAGAGLLVLVDAFHAGFFVVFVLAFILFYLLDTKWLARKNTKKEKDSERN